MRGKTQGSIYQRASDGLWVGSVDLPIRDGKRRRKVVTVNPHYPKELTEKQARIAILAKLNAVKAEKEKTGDLPTASQTLGQWLNTWYADIAVKKIRPKTARTYRSLLENHIIPTIGATRLDQLTPAHIRRVETSILGKGLSPTTAMQAHTIIRVALKYAEQEGRVSRNVAKLTDAPRKARPTLAVLTSADARAILQTVASDRLGSRWAAALLTGARQGELLGLELDRVTDFLDLSWQLQRLSWEHGCRPLCGAKRPSECPARTITHPHDYEARHLTGGLWLTRPKSAAGTRMFPLVEPLRTIIERRIAAAATEPNPFGLLWTSDLKKVSGHDVYRPSLDGSPIDPSTDNHAWHAVLDRAAVSQVRLHDARHTTASLLLDAGVREEIIMKLLGHSTNVVTRSYQNVDRRQLEAAATALSNTFQIDDPS